MSLDELVRDVANLRASRDRFAADLKLREEKFREENACLIADLSERKEELMRAEEELRAAVLAASEDEVKATFGVGIRQVSRLEYDDAEAIRWAVDQKQYAVLSLQKKDFEKAAKHLISMGIVNLPSHMIPSFVVIRNEMQATIAKDLSKVLKDDSS